MEALFASGRIVDAVIALAVLEGFALALHHRLTGRGVAPRDYLVNLLSGLCLMFALRSLLAGAAWFWPAWWLAAAGLAHGAALWSRWRRQPLAITPS